MLLVCLVCFFVFHVLILFVPPCWFAFVILSIFFLSFQTLIFFVKVFSVLFIYDSDTFFSSAFLCFLSIHRRLLSFFFSFRFPVFFFFRFSAIRLGFYFLFYTRVHTSAFLFSHVLLYSCVLLIFFFLFIFSCHVLFLSTLCVIPLSPFFIF